MVRYSGHLDVDLNLMVGYKVIVNTGRVLFLLVGCYLSNGFPCPIRFAGMLLLKIDNPAAKTTTELHLSTIYCSKYEGYVHKSRGLVFML